MDRDEYVRRRFSKLSSKTWKLFVITRVYHRLDDPEIEFVCQQHVRTQTGRYLTDLYFPQFNLHLEIDEKGHVGKETHDLQRSRSIAETIGHEIVRIPVYDTRSGKDLTLDQVKVSVDDFVERLKGLKQKLVRNGTFAPWTDQNRYDPKQYYERGYISADDNPIFKTQVDAMRCFGFSGKGYQRGAWRVKGRPGHSAWFPRLIRHHDWSNSLSANGSTITEQRADMKAVLSLWDKEYSDVRYVFARMDDHLGGKYFRFLGQFSLDKSQSTTSKRIYIRQEIRVQTISPTGE